MKNPQGLWVPYFCTSCESVAPFEVTEQYKYGQIYGIRVAKYKARYWLVCKKCERAIELSTKEQFLTAQAIGRKLAIEWQENWNLSFYLQEVARWVFGDSELADRLSNLPEGETKEELEEESRVAIESPTDGESSKKCPDCAEMVKQEARKCRFCGYIFDAV